MKLLVDINVLLDVLLDREPHAAASSAVWSAIERSVAEGLVAAHAVTTIYYLIRREQNEANTKRTVGAVMSVFGVAPVDQSVIREALAMPMGDFEDAVTAAAARRAGCDLIVTRDPKGFRGSTVRALAPEAVVALLG